MIHAFIPGTPVPQGSVDVYRGRIVSVKAPLFPPVRDRKTGKLKSFGPWLNSNDRLHRQQEAKITKAWREAAAEASKHIGPLNPPVHIVAHIWKPRAGRYDPNNLAPTTKAIVDGFVDAGLVPDDSVDYVIGPDHRHGGKGNAAIVLEIREITPSSDKIKTAPEMLATSSGA